MKAPDTFASLFRMTNGALVAYSPVKPCDDATIGNLWKTYPRLVLYHRLAGPPQLFVASPGMMQAGYVVGIVEPQQYHEASAVQP